MSYTKLSHHLTCNISFETMQSSVMVPPHFHEDVDAWFEALYSGLMTENVELGKYDLVICI